MGPFFASKITKFCSSETKKSLKKRSKWPEIRTCPKIDFFSIFLHFRKSAQNWPFWGPSGRAKRRFLMKNGQKSTFFGLLRCSCWKMPKRSKIRIFERLGIFQHEHLNSPKNVDFWPFFIKNRRFARPLGPQKGQFWADFRKCKKIEKKSIFGQVRISGHFDRFLSDFLVSEEQNLVIFEAKKGPIFWQKNSDF